VDQRRIGSQRGLWVDQRRQGLVLHLDQVDRVPGSLRRGSHYRRQRLTHESDFPGSERPVTRFLHPGKHGGAGNVAHASAIQIGNGDGGDHPLGGAGRGEIKRHHSSMSVRRSQDADGVQIGEPKVVDVSAEPLNQSWIFGPFNSTSNIRLAPRAHGVFPC
jgi:hypothetical protein